MSILFGGNRLAIYSEIKDNLEARKVSLEDDSKLNTLIQVIAIVMAKNNEAIEIRIDQLIKQTKEEIKREFVGN